MASFPNPETQFSSENQPEKHGRPKGSKNWSTLVQDLLMDEDFVISFTDGSKKKFPAKVITEAMLAKAASGDVGAAKWLRETGYGNRLEVSMTDSERKFEEIAKAFANDRTQIPVVTAEAPGDDSAEA